MLVAYPWMNMTRSRSGGSGGAAGGIAGVGSLWWATSCVSDMVGYSTEHSSIQAVKEVQQPECVTRVSPAASAKWKWPGDRSRGG